jgi:hypothetical protein
MASATARTVRCVHHSRVYALLIDAPEADAEAAAVFWTAALGVFRAQATTWP